MKTINKTKTKFKMKNKMKTIKLLAVLFISTLVFTGCSDDDDHGDDHSDEEVITTFTYTLTAGSNTVVMVFDDPDGDGSLPPTITGGTLMANTTYTGSIRLENRTENPVEDKTPEILAEADEHEFFFTTNINDLTVTKTDVDANNNPLGLETTVTTTAAGSGTLSIVLKHDLTKPNNFTAANADGSTDIEVTFPVTVQ